MYQNFGVAALVIGPANTYTGATQVLGGRLDINTSERLPDGTDLTVTAPGRVVILGGGTETVGSLAGDGQVLFAFSPGASLRVGQNNASTVFSGFITGSVGGAVTVNAGGTLAPGISPGILIVGSSTFKSDSQFAIDLVGSGGVAGTDFDQLIVLGGVDLVGDPILSVLSSGGFLPTVGDEFPVLTWQTGLSGTFDLLVDPFFLANDISIQSIITNAGGAGDLTLRAVPETASLALLGLGALAVLAQRRHKNLS